MGKKNVKFTFQFSLILTYLFGHVLTTKYIQIAIYTIYAELLLYQNSERTLTEVPFNFYHIMIIGNKQSLTGISVNIQYNMVGM